MTPAWGGFAKEEEKMELKRSIPRTGSAVFAVTVFLLAMSFIAISVCSAEETHSYELGDLYEVHYGRSGETRTAVDSIHADWKLGQFYVKGYVYHSVEAGVHTFFIKNSEELSLTYKINYTANSLQKEKNLKRSGSGMIVISNAQHERIQSRNTNLDLFYAIQSYPVANLGPGEYHVDLRYDLSWNYGLFNMLEERHEYLVTFDFKVVALSDNTYLISNKTNAMIRQNSILDKGFRIESYGPNPPVTVVTRATVSKVDGEYKVKDSEQIVVKDGDSFTDYGIYTVVIHYPNSAHTKVYRVCMGKKNGVTRAYFNKYINKAHVDPSYIPPTNTPVPTPSPTPVPTATPFAVLAKNSKGEAVLELQKLLREYGYYSGEPNGKYDNNTIKAVKDFQFMHRIKETGNCDEATWKRIHEGYVTRQRNVYVSKNNLVHFDPSCSNMRHYRTMKLSDAERRGYAFCGKCH